MSERYYQMDVKGKQASIVIYGDITSWPWTESDVSSYNLSKQLAQLGDVDEIEVRINSYGGEVAEGIAIYNALKNHSASVRTVCDGFACSIASVIFMAGDERVMNEASLLMIHNAWMSTSGNSEELRKDADDLDTITDVSKGIYLASTDLSEDELAEWMDAETFIDSETALARGFATEVIPIEGDKASQSARMLVADRLLERSVPLAVQLDTEAVVNALIERASQADEPMPEAPAQEAPEAEAETQEDMTDLRIAQAYMDMQSI